MAKSGIRFEGIKDLQDKLRGNITMEAVKVVVRKNGDELNQNMKRRAGSGGAFTKGYSTGDTKRSINTVLTDGGLTAEVEPGTDYSPYVEYGTRFMDAEPFVRPAFEMQEQKFKTELEKLCR